MPEDLTIEQLYQKAQLNSYAEYLSVAVRCSNAEAYWACMIMTSNAVFCSLRDYLRDLDEAHGQVIDTVPGQRGRVDVTKIKTTEPKSRHGRRLSPPLRFIISGGISMIAAGSIAIAWPWNGLRPIGIILTALLVMLGLACLAYGAVLLHAARTQK